MSYPLFWGDLHSHCAISYGEGTLEQALRRAAQQLDFCSVTGHAFWPDMPTDRGRYAEIIDYHEEGFARLARNWDRLLAAQAEASAEGTFLALPSYEWHSLTYGDHNVYAPGPELALRDAADLPALRELCREAGAIAIPHHIGYKAGYRGIDWEHFREDISPFVEIFSLHGCSVADDAPFPLLHDMGPRDAGSTAEAGWQRGHRFGIVGGTDHHGAYPGSHGDGRMGVFAKNLTRDALWEAFLARRVFAATGDRIDARLFVDDAWIGEEIRSPGSRRLVVSVRGADALDRVEVVKNGRLLHRLVPDGITQRQPAAHDSETAGRSPETAYRLRLTWGWGRKDVPVSWNARLRLSDGAITTVETCFSGQPIVAPQKAVGSRQRAAGSQRKSEIPNPKSKIEPPNPEHDLPHEVTERTTRSIAWRSVTTGNPTMRHATTQGLSLEVDAAPATRVVVEVNGCRFEHALEELLHAGRSHFLRGWLSEAIRIGPAVPLFDCGLEAAFDDEPEREIDIYRLQVAQRNGHWAWLSPIWVAR